MRLHRASVVARVVLMFSLVTLVAVGCGGSGGGGGSAAAPTPVARAITVTSGGTDLGVGQTMQMSATVTMSDGSTQTATGGSWTTDSPSIVSVSSTGLVTGLAVGGASVFYDVGGGVKNGKGLSVYANFAGTWRGNYQVTGCTESGIFASVYHFCRDSMTVGNTLPYTLVITQSGSSSVSVQPYLGQLAFQTAVSNINGPQIVLSSRYFGTSQTVVALWTLSQASSSRITGTLQQTWTDNIYVGQAVVTANIISSAPAFGSVFDMQGRWVSPATFADLMSAIRTR